MLKKLNGKTTKLLFYIKNNLVSCVFKLSILSTMLVLVYLVCMLSQTNSVNSNDNSPVYPFEHSQKLMLTIPTENPENVLSDVDSLFSTTTTLTTTIIDNSILENDDTCIETDPLIPLQEPTTTPMPLLEQIKFDIEPEVTIVESSLQESTTEEKLVTITSTEETITEHTDLDNTTNDQETCSTETIISVLKPIITEPEIPVPAVSAYPIKRSLTLDEINKFKATSIETTTESQLMISTSTVALLEDTEKKIEEFSTNLLTPSQSNDVEDAQNNSSNDVEDVQNNSPTPGFSIPPSVSEDDLFLDNWTNHLTENEDINRESIEDSLNIMEPTKSLFENEDSDLEPIESPVSKDESNDTSLLQTPIGSDSENLSNIPYSDTDESYPIFSPQNLLNLFSFDHQPSSSNLKATWWPKPRSSSMSALAESAAKNQKKRENKIPLNDDSQEMSGNQRMFSQRFNRKRKNSVGILERLFGNYFLQRG